MAALLVIHLFMRICWLMACGDLFYQLAKQQSIKSVAPDSSATGLGLDHNPNNHVEFQTLAAKPWGIDRAVAMSIAFYSKGLLNQCSTRAFCWTKWLRSYNFPISA
ncbi:MAG: hypothetical protein EBS30_10255 [Planctomycetes bacterium]|nr:hypothetical protein [Planctomycetota bacterium]